MASQDSVYKSLFTQPEVLQSLIRHYGPDELADMLDFSSLENIGADLLAESGQSRQSDLIFKINFRDKGYLYLILLLEIQGSQYQKILALRMLEYVVLIWRKLLLQEKSLKKLPPVLPILLHTGSRPFRKSPRIRDLMGAHPKFLEKFQPQFEFFLVDECQLAAKAKGRTDPTSILMASNQARTIDDFQNAMEQINRLAANQELRDLARQLLRWLTKVGRKEFPQFGNEMEEIELENLQEGIVMLQDNLRKMRQDIYEEGVVFGREEGLLSGIQKGIEKGKLLGLLAGALETLLQLYRDGDVSLEKTSARMKALLGQGNDELVQEYLQKLK